VKLGQNGGDGGNNRRSHFFSQGAAQGRSFGHHANKQNFLGTLATEFGEEQRFDERRIVRADTLRNGNRNELVFAIDMGLTCGGLGANCIDQNDDIVTGEERGDAEALGYPGSWRVTLGGNS
jgi:hypothetical protein